MIVVGPGMAGLFAALALSEAGIPVRIFEAADDIGARGEVVAGIVRRELALAVGAN